MRLRRVLQAVALVAMVLFALLMFTVASHRPSLQPSFMLKSESHAERQLRAAVESLELRRVTKAIEVAERDAPDLRLLVLARFVRDRLEADLGVKHAARRPVRLPATADAAGVGVGEAAGVHPRTDSAAAGRPPATGTSPRTGGSGNSGGVSPATAATPPAPPAGSGKLSLVLPLMPASAAEAAAQHERADAEQHVQHHERDMHDDDHEDDGDSESAEQEAAAAAAAAAATGRTDGARASATGGTGLAGKKPRRSHSEKHPEEFSAAIQAARAHAISVTASAAAAAAPLIPIETKFPTSSFPIAVVAFNREALLKECLDSLLRLPGIAGKSQITVYQDGTDQGVQKLAKKYEVGLVQNTVSSPFWDGATRIAQHYKFLLSHAFDSNPAAPYIIVVEEDMVFAPDFLIYFAQLAHLYEVDPTVYCITSWNDNGFKGMVKDPQALYRTEFMVGLGWLVSREIYKGEFEAIWPMTHWDHWMREAQQRKGRECVYPELSRNYNIGKHGTHTDLPMFEQYFQHIQLNDQPNVHLGDTERVVLPNYEEELKELISEAIPISSLTELRDVPADETVVMCYSAHAQDDPVWETIVAPHFGLWHSIPYIRGQHNGMHRFWWKGRYMFLLASYSPYLGWRKSRAKCLTGGDFELTMRLQDMTVFVAPHAANCQIACRERGLKCDRAGLRLVNNCEQLRAHYDCSKCENSEGADQPAVVTVSSESNFGVCLVHGKPDEMQCMGSHRLTSRLCACHD